MSTSAWIVFVVWVTALSAYDIRQRRLPNFLTIGGLVVIVALGAFPRVIVGALALGIPYLAVHSVSRRSLGAGDVKLAFAVGAVATTSGAHAWVLSALGGPLVSALVGVLLLVRRQNQSIPHGVSMCVATVVGLSIG